MLDGGDSDAHGGLEGVVDPPLEAGEGTDHKDTGAEAAPDAGGAQLGEHLAGRLAALGHLRHHGVGRVGHDGARHTWKKEQPHGRDERKSEVR